MLPSPAVIFPASHHWHPQGFTSLNATAHSLIAASLSRQRSGEAAGILARVAQLAVALALPLAVGLLVLRDTLPGVFTSDSIVIGEVAEVLPLLLVLLPLDALGTVLEGGACCLPAGACFCFVWDSQVLLAMLPPMAWSSATCAGGLLGAADTRWIASRAAVSSMLALGTLVAASTSHGGLLVVWTGMKVRGWPPMADVATRKTCCGWVVAGLGCSGAVLFVVRFFCCCG